MKTKLKWCWGIIFFLSLIFLAGHTAWADPPWGCDVPITGTLCDIISANDGYHCAIVISQDGSCDAETNVAVHGISAYHLAQRHNLDLYGCLEQGCTVHVWAHACPIDMEQEIYRACTISVEDGDDINLLPTVPIYQQWHHQVMNRNQNGCDCCEEGNQNQQTNQNQNGCDCCEGGNQNQQANQNQNACDCCEEGKQNQQANQNQNAGDCCEEGKQNQEKKQNQDSDGCREGGNQKCKK